jgi:hypothetical protein
MMGCTTNGVKPVMNHVTPPSEEITVSIQESILASVLAKTLFKQDLARFSKCDLRDLVSRFFYKIFLLDPA